MHGPLLIAERIQFVGTGYSGTALKDFGNLEMMAAVANCPLQEMYCQAAWKNSGAT